MAGRKSKLTPEVQKKIVTAISSGNYYEASCKYAGIGYQTFRNWMISGEEVRDGKRRRTKANLEFLEFLEAVEQAEAQAEIRIVANWQRHIPSSWQAGRDFLARRFPDRWKPQEGRELSGEVGTKVTVYIPANKRNDNSGK